MNGKRPSQSCKFRNSIKTQKNTRQRLDVITKEEWREYLVEMLNESGDEYKMTLEEPAYNLEGERGEIKEEHPTRTN